MKHGNRSLQAVAITIAAAVCNGARQVGNKIDLPDVAVPTAEGKALADELGMAFVGTCCTADS